MPQLENPRHEAFARAIAMGATVTTAYLQAGYAPSDDHGYRIKRRPEIVERIAELQAEQADIGAASTRRLLSLLLDAAESMAAVKSPAGVKELRGTVEDVLRLRSRLEAEIKADAIWEKFWEEKDLTDSGRSR